VIRIDKKYFTLPTYSAPAELISGGGCRPPVAPEVIHIAPHTVVPLLNPFRIYYNFTNHRIINCNGDLCDSAGQKVIKYIL
jgi:hypothetical protein